MGKKVSRRIDCNLCGSKEQTFKYTVKKGGKPFKAVQCSCGMLFVNPQPSMEFISTFYDEDYFSGKKKHNAPGQMDLEKHRDNFMPNINKCIAMMHKRKKKGKYLDVGCATGHYVELFQELGWKSQGIDISEYSTEYGRTERGLDIITGDVVTAGLPKGRYDLITLLNVIEHVPDPTAMVKELERILHKNGTLAISTPNAGYMVAKMSKENWWGWNDEGHIFLFSLATLEKLLDKAGLELYAIGSPYSYGNSVGAVWKNAPNIKIKGIRLVEYTLITKLSPAMFKVSRPLADLLTPGTISFARKRT